MLDIQEHLSFDMQVVEVSATSLTWLTSTPFTPMYIRVRRREHIPYCNKCIGPLFVKKMIWTENKLARRMRVKTADFKTKQNTRFSKRDKTADFQSGTK